MAKEKVIDKLKNDPLMPLRHTAEHVLHTAVEKAFPGAKKVMGPPIENGFYCDFDYDGKINEEDFPKIEGVMQEIIDAGLPVKKHSLSSAEAKKIFKDNDFKLELIDEHSKDGGELFFYTFGVENDKYYDIDLCAGPHVENTKEIKAFKLLSVAGAYWRGDEKNKMLIRIYATAFDTKEKLDAYLELLEEQKRRDHRKLGRDLEIFMISDEVGPGLPLWLPNGKSKPRSYRDLPLRLAEYGTVARYENRGSLNGILRPRLFTQNDAHVYCSEEQAVDVFVEIMDLHRYYYDKLGLKDYRIVLGLPDPEKKDKYHGDKEMWEKAEKMSRTALEKAGMDYEEEVGGAAHYGPKMDLKIKSAIGNEYAISTNQIDLYMPGRFGLTFTDKDGKEKPVVVQHRAPLGSDERFIGFLLEQFAGNMPVWLSPVQVVIVPIGEKHNEYAVSLEKILKEEGLRVQTDTRSQPMNARIRDAQMMKVPYMLIVGDKEIESETASVRLRTGENLGPIKTGEIISKIKEIYLTRDLSLW
ncbi:MAG: Threonine-tRNA ligase [candidate division WWE3 bacterium GW2011_GWC1_42_102]|nr:MAG: Threonine-tRNA ligase [candidate division WWE3 bacterium GW2011_GWC1_42_102]